jgi:hypothetical protein
MRWAWAMTIEPNLPAPIRPTRTGRPAEARAAKRVKRFICFLPIKSPIVSMGRSLGNGFA